ncbi:3-hydroxyacyl-CoA dehydrogenase NAD-binding domain-containing protein [Kordiimonas marina]|uniref:3-hydroxyacyl-CoA dehydrogenase NAD-binding domain-containing protein n=1 Tax=Kordiimonas marina TaxID=2872312 RepID=UPI001FF1DD31|nr:3-hydroxyacyl-CoA dehydrogenase NAD-binding domain-containing protein [Kordiimonas marina]MCJ9428327.1 enoyl-CoA hydratase/isomerase family protein [Kordiimonas marina]
MTDTIRFDVDSDGIATLTIDLPNTGMNVFNADLINDLDALVDKVLADDAIKGAVITSGKPAFLAGADLNMLGAQAGGKQSLEEQFEGAFRLNKIFRKIETGGKPKKVLAMEGTKPFAAAVNGLALGGGFELVLACHYRVITDDASMQLGFPEVQVGLLPGAGGTQRLPRIIGIQAAAGAITTGKPFKGPAALGMGIVQEMVPTDKVVEAAKAWVKKSPSAIAPWDKKGFKYPGGAGAMNPAAVQTFIGANAMAQKQTQHNYPAIQAILSCLYEGGIVDFDTAIRIESKYFMSLLKDPVAGNMIRSLFINKQAVEKGSLRPEGFERRQVKRLGMLGAGLMGAGVAYVSAKAGMDVVLLDRDMAAAEKGKDYSRKLVEKGIGRGQTTKEKGDALLSHIIPTDNYDDLKDCDLIIEAVFEAEDIKKDVTQKTEAVIGKDVVFASNTSTLPITGLAKNFGRPHQFIGIHFFSPVDKMPLVEIIMGEKTDDETLALALDYVSQIRKTPIVVNDSRGFYTSRCFGTYVQEGYAMVKEGVNPALIENAGKMSGMPVGPLAVGDEVAIDLSYKVGQATKKALGDKYVPSPADGFVEKMVVDLERFGRKNGKGAYVYPEDGSPKYLWPGLAEEFPLAADQPSVDEVESRLMVRMAVECARCFEEGVLRDTASGDIGAIFGWGFAPWTGGPFSFIDTMGVAAFVAEADRLAQAYGQRFTPPQLLRDMAAKGETFYKPGDSRGKIPAKKAA